jgi:hypothetical protein
MLVHRFVNHDILLASGGRDDRLISDNKRQHLVQSWADYKIARRTGWADEFYDNNIGALTLYKDDSAWRSEILGIRREV